MKRQRLGIVVLGIVVLLAATAATQTQQQVLAVGIQKLVKVDFLIGRVAIGNDQVCDFRVLDSRREVLLTGRRLGETTLTLWDQQGNLQREIVLRVRPSSGSAKQIIDELEQLLGGIEGLQYKEVGGSVWLEGEVLTERDAERIDKVLEGYPEVRSLVELSPITQQMMDRAEASSIKTVQMDVTILEVDKSMVRNLGVRWSSSLTPSSSLPFEGSSVGPLTGVVENILPSIEALTSNGAARVMARPTLITRSGQKAELFVGGELPIPVAQGGGSVTIEYKEYGVKLEFEPIVDTQNNINIQIFVEMSSLGAPVVDGGAPGLITNRVSTNVFLKEGESITLGGLVRSEDAESIDKMPGLGSIPIIGNLFKSKRYLRNQTELLIFASPRVVTAAEAGSDIRDRVTTDFQEFEQIESHKPKKKKKP